MRLGRVLRGAAAAAVAALSAAALVVTAGPAASAQDPGPGFAPAGQATVRPGSMTYTAGAQCTSDFVFTDGTDVYLGQAAHCAGTGGSDEVDGCSSGSLPLGTPVEVVGASRPGTLAYSSWLSMQAAGETDPDTCLYNDFALVRLDPADVSRTNPSLPHYGGPVGIDADGTQPGEIVFGYGNSELRAGIEALRPKTGTSLGTTAGGWSHTVATAPPGIPGDSGSPYVSADGTALGLLSTLMLAPEAGTNGVADLRSVLDYANSSGDLDGDVALVPGDQPFTPNPLPVG